MRQVRGIFGTLGAPASVRAVSLGLLVLGLSGGFLSAGPPDPSGVKLTRTSLTIPTYLAGEPERNPVFYFGRAYQGARGPVYPYPLPRYPDGSENRHDLHRSLSWKTNTSSSASCRSSAAASSRRSTRPNGYDFFYRQHVIKPALIGMLGAWISGGVEWNIPHHHRATTFLPVDWARLGKSRRREDDLGRGDRAPPPDAVERGADAPPRLLGARGQLPDLQPHPVRPLDPLLGERRRPGERGLPDHLPAGHAVGRLSRQERIFPLARFSRGL